MHHCYGISAARQHREFRHNVHLQCLAQALYLSMVQAARRLGCLQLQQLLSGIPNSNDDFAGF